jgi:hypothetical protein
VLPLEIVVGQWADELERAFTGGRELGGEALPEAVRGSQQRRRHGASQSVRVANKLLRDSVSRGWAKTSLRNVSQVTPPIRDTWI